MLGEHQPPNKHERAPALHETSFSTRRKKALEEFKRKPAVEAKGRRLETLNAVDYLVGREQTCLRAAEEYLNDVRNKENSDDKAKYEEEQSATKLVAYWMAKVEQVTRYAELKRDFPNLARDVEEEHPATILELDAAAHEWREISSRMKEKK